ncbi:helix-turn-helix domain-containing protein [Microbacterium arborescens]|uniref:helix-turn-helix domain-containing protein n=1 Tax=Microbacterium arborescens TaxID=33883 RepID=UPI003C74B780
MASSDEAGTPPGAYRVLILIDEVLEEKGMTLTELAQRTGITIANLSALKNNRGKAIRFTTLTAICGALEVEPARLFALRPR